MLHLFAVYSDILNLFLNIEVIRVFLPVLIKLKYKYDVSGTIFIKLIKEIDTILHAISQSLLLPNTYFGV